MTSPEERIRELARARKVDDAEAERLLDAVRPRAQRTSRFNPFERWSGEVTSMVGVVVSLLGIATSRLSIRYPGAIDLKTAHGTVPLALAALDQLVAYAKTM